MSTLFQDTLKDSIDKLNIIAAKKGALVKTQTPVAFLSATCYLDNDNAVVNFNAFKDDPGLLVTLLKTALDSSPELAYLGSNYCQPQSRQLRHSLTRGFRR